MKSHDFFKGASTCGPRKRQLTASTAPRVAAARRQGPCWGLVPCGPWSKAPAVQEHFTSIAAGEEPWLGFCGDLKGLSKGL